LELNKYNRIYFVGIGGIGMSALASWFSKAGFRVAGYDKSASDITTKLEKEGIRVSFDESVAAIPDDFKTDLDKILVIYTPAIPKQHEGLVYFNSNNYTIIKRAAALGLLVKEKKGIAVAGTHGKTSVSTTTAWLLNQSCSAFFGGVSKNLESNVIINPSADKVVIEADEYDRSFLTLFPETLVVTSMDADHLDIYSDKEEIVATFYQFIGQIKKDGILIYKNGLSIPFNINSEISYFTYSLQDVTSDFYASNIHIVDGQYCFNWHYPQGMAADFLLGVPGLYNLENAVAALAAAWLNGASVNELKTKLATYKGVKRRFDFHIRTQSLVYIDDYAHHPEEIRVCIESVRHLFPNRKITVVFQPHLYSRTRDFATDFAHSLDLCDSVILVDIYPAREEPIAGVTSQIILDKMHLSKKVLCSYNQVLDQIDAQPIDILITMGAGNIDRLIIPITEALKQKYREAK